MCLRGNQKQKRLPNARPVVAALHGARRRLLEHRSSLGDSARRRVRAVRRPSIVAVSSSPNASSSCHHPRPPLPRRRAPFLFPLRFLSPTDGNGSRTASTCWCRRPPGPSPPSSTRPRPETGRRRARSSCVPEAAAGWARGSRRTTAGSGWTSEGAPRRTVRCTRDWPSSSPLARTRRRDGTHRSRRRQRRRRHHRRRLPRRGGSQVRPPPPPPRGARCEAVGVRCP